MTAANDLSDLPAAEFQELLDRIEREPEAPEAFDATAALRRVLALADELEATARAANYWEGPAERAAARRIRAAVAGQP